MHLTIWFRRAILAAVLASLFASTPAHADAQRIVALTPFGANVLADLGVKPVGIGDGAGGDQHLARSLRNVPRLPLSHASNGPNLEQLVDLNPDLMLSERTWAAGHEAVEDLGIQVEEPDPYRIASVRNAILTIGHLVDREEKATKLANRTVKQIQKARRGIESRPRVLMILGVGETPYAFLPNSWGGDLAIRAGANLITQGLESAGSDLLVSGGYAQLSDEEILVRNPDVIIAVPHGRSEDMDAIAEQLRNDETFASTNAGANDRIYVTQDNGLLQASTEAARTIRMVRREFLLNL